MAITVNFPIDLVQLNDLIAQGYTSLVLYVSNTPEGPYVDTGVASDPASLALGLTAGEPYIFEFPYSSGNAAQWFKVRAFDGGNASDINDAQTFHGGGGTTLARIRQKLGKLIKCIEFGTTTSDGGGSGDSAICVTPTFKRRRDHYFGGSGAGESGHIFYRLDTNEWTEVSDWTQGSGTFSLSPSFSTQVEGATSFEVVSRWTPDELRDAINWAIVNTYPTLSKVVVDLATITEDNVWQYDIPNNIRILSSVEIESLDNSTYTDNETKGQPWQHVPYFEYIDGLSRKIEFKQEPPFQSGIGGYRLRMTGTSLLNFLYNDTDYVEVVEPQVELITYLAAYKLYLDLTNTSSSNDKDLYKEQAGAYLALYEKYKAHFGSRRRAKRIWQASNRWNGSGLNAR